MDVLVCVIAMAGMAVSAVSACACVHHAERAADPGCHSAEGEYTSQCAHKTSHRASHGVHTNHHETEAANVEHGGDAYDAPCNCGNADSVTAATVRGESVRHPAAMHSAAPDGPRFEYEHREAVGAVSVPDDHISSYTSLFWTRSGPSRAPPRL